jgi:hypothetical protein
MAEDETLYSDDLLPLDSSMLNLDPDPEQVREEQAERTEILAAAPILNSLLEWFDSEIAMCDTLEGITLEADSIDIKAQLLARQLLKAKLQAVKNNLEVKKDSFLPQYKH